MNSAPMNGTSSSDAPKTARQTASVTAAVAQAALEQPAVGGAQPLVGRDASAP